VELIWAIAIPSPIKRNTYLACPDRAVAVFRSVPSAAAFADKGNVQSSVRKAPKAKPFIHTGSMVRFFKSFIMVYSSEFKIKDTMSKDC
jgi:hypothetical protein